MITNSASNNQTGLRVVIAGGGIAGLSLARAERRSTRPTRRRTQH
jgi:cation diffusion facilitator CzcD-associated flavoprotein CzcO